MRTLFIINLHSILDVITNSSTELFVCDTNKTVEMIKEILAADPNVCGYKEPWIFNLKEYREFRKKERERIARWEETHEPCDCNNPYYAIEGWFYDTEDEEDMKYLREQFIEDGDRSGYYWISTRNPYTDRIYKVEEKAAKTDPGKWEIQYKAKLTEIEKIYKEVEAMDVKPEWWINPNKFHYNEQPVNDLDGKIIIVGEDDNSISCDHFDWIENTFNAQRHHLG